MKARIARASIGASVIAMLCGPAAAADWLATFKDPVDQRFDASKWLLSRHGFLPVPIIITEPAVGYGGGAALLFFHRNQPTNPSNRAGNSHRTSAPPSVTGVFAAATENGTRMGGVGHLGVWRDDSVRFTGGAGLASVDLKFYGDERHPRLSNGVGYEIEGWGAFTQLIWRLGRSNFWLGPQLAYMDATLDFGADAAALGDLQGEVENVGAGAIVTYDDRDNIFSPSRGLESSWLVRRHWGELVNDFDYTQVEGKNRWYVRPAQRWVIALRLDMSFIVGGEAPFYARPSIDQRGIAKKRYQGDAVIDGEIEARYSLDDRWSAVTFVGVGRAADSTGDLHDANGRWAGGVGLRYLIARLLGLQVGVDVARGSDEWAFYIQTGSGW